MTDYDRSLLIYWQQKRADAYWLMTLCMDEGEIENALYWQEQHAYCHNCFVCNLELIERDDY